MLSKTQLNELRDKLEEQRDLLVTAVRTAPKQGSTDHGDPADISASVIQADILWGLEQHEHDQVMEIDSALSRMHDGTYGKCEECGKDIPFARLQVMPTARHDVLCKEKLEKQGMFLYKRD